MKKTKKQYPQLCFRVPQELIERLDAWIGSAEAGMLPGLNVTRSQAARALIEQALIAAERKTKRAAK